MCVCVCVWGGKFTRSAKVLRRKRGNIKLNAHFGWMIIRLRLCYVYWQICAWAHLHTPTIASAEVPISYNDIAPACSNCKLVYNKNKTKTTTVAFDSELILRRTTVSRHVPYLWLCVRHKWHAFSTFQQRAGPPFKRHKFSLNMATEYILVFIYVSRCVYLVAAYGSCAKTLQTIN